MSKLPSQFTIGNFRFKGFDQDKTKHQVVCVVQWAGGFTELIPLKEVKDMLDDLGKWEALAKTIQDLNLAGIPNSVPENFGRSLYEITVQKRIVVPSIVASKEASVTFVLTREEALRRTNGEDESVPLDLDEIKNQIQNLRKWKNFASVVKHLKEIQPREPSS